MKKIAAGFAGIVLAVSLTACGDGDAEPTATETVTVAPETTAPQEPSYSSEPAAPETEDVPDALFAGIVRENTNSFDLDTDADIVAAAHSVCDYWDTGATIQDVVQVVIDSGVDPEDGGFLVGAGTEAYCSEHSYKIEEFTGNGA